MRAWADAAEVPGGDLEDFEYLGRGGSAVVYRARQRSLDRSVAVKVPEDLDLREGGLPREARTQAAMSWHSNVVTLLGTTELEDGRPAMVLEFAPGGSLAERIRRRGPLTPSQWRRMGAELSDALAAAHAEGLVHRDVKPSNVLFASDDTCRLADFGLTTSTLATVDEWAGSVAFAPPEYLEGSPATPANDVYSCALTLMVAATGRTPFGADELPPAAVMARVQSERIRFSDEVEGVEPQLAELLDAALDPDPTARPSARTLADALGRSGATPGAAGPATPGGRRRIAPAVAAAILLLALAGTVLVVGTRTREEPAVNVDLCASFRDFGESRRALFDQVSVDLERSSSPTDVVDRLLVRYPADWAATVSPFLQDVARLSGRPPVATDAQLASLAQADVLRALGGGKPFVFDGQSGAFEPASVPASLREPASSFSSATELAASSCPADVVDLSASKARMYSAIYANLANPEFMSSFFDDPRSLTLFGSETTLLMNQIARPFFESMLEGRWDWFSDLLSASPEVRSVLSLEAPDLVLRAGLDRPERFESEMTPEWREELRAGFDRLGPAARTGVETLYPEQLRVIGRGTP